MSDQTVDSEVTVGGSMTQVFESPESLGRAAARHTAEILRECVAKHGHARVVIATGNSQLPFVRALATEPDVPWSAVTVFHLDEYVGIAADHPASFRRWIVENIEDPLGPAEVHYIQGDAADPEAEASRYEKLLTAEPLDLVCMGIGENGHIAFNEPYQADLADPRWVRVIVLDERSRKQQVGEGHFPSVDAVPDQAITLTVPALLAPRHIQVVVPERRKAEAVLNALTQPVSNAYPATVLREQDNARLFLDTESAALLDGMGEPFGPPVRRNFSPYEMFLTLARRHVPRHRFRPGSDVDAWRSEALPAVLATLGKLPEPVDPRPELLAEWEQDGVIRQRWMLDVSAGLSAFAYVNRPADLPAGECRPGILCWHGHTAGGKEAVMGNDSTPELAASVTRAGYGYAMAQAGFVTFAIDWMGYGDQDDSAKPNHRDLERSRNWCNLYYLHATMLGMTPLGINLAHGKALTDFVSTLPFVDADRLGVMGLSGGGTMTVWSALADSRLSAVEVICYSDVFADFGYRDINYCGSQITPGLYELVDVADLQGLIAPRPLLVDIGTYDECFRLESALACYARVQDIYTAAEAADSVERNIFPGGHGWPGSKSVDFFRRHLTGTR